MGNGAVLCYWLYIGLVQQAEEQGDAGQTEPCCGLKMECSRYAHAFGHWDPAGGAVWEALGSTGLLDEVSL